MKKKISKKMIFSLAGGLAAVLAFIATPIATMAAETKESCTIYHHHTEACNGTVYVEQTCDGTSWLRTVATDTCTVCGDYHDYYQYDGSCSCGKTWYSTGHACINSPEGSNHGTCSNYSKIDCDTTHSHPTTEIVCGKTESTSIGTVTVRRSTTEPTQELVLAASSSGSMENVSFAWKGSATSSSGGQFTVTANGTYLLYISYTENGINYMQEMSVKVTNIDKEAPVISRLSADITTPVAGTVRLTVVAKDSSGFPAKYVSWNGAEYTGGSTYEVSENGLYSVRVRDLAGNIASAEIMVSNIDNEKPVIRNIVMSTEEYTSGEVVLDVVAEDNNPWPNAYISWNDGEYSSDTHFAVTENGSYTVAVKDAAGNITEKSIVITNIDKTAPVINEWKAEPDVPTSEDIIIQIEVEDEGGFPEKYIIWNGEEPTDENTFSVDKNGIYEVTVVDKAGNRVSREIKVENIDKIPPVIHALEVITQPWYSGECVVGVTAQDESDGTLDYMVSGLPSEAYSWDEGKTWTSDDELIITEEGVVTVYVRDVAGNIAKESVEVKRTSLPTVPDKEENSDNGSDDAGSNNGNNDAGSSNGNNDTGSSNGNNDTGGNGVVIHKEINWESAENRLEEEEENAETSEEVVSVEILEKEEASFLVSDDAKEAEILEQKDSRAFRSLGKILVAVLGCLGFLLLGLILFVFLGMCRIYCVSDKQKEIYLGSVGIGLRKEGFKVKIGENVLEDAESRNMRIKIPGWFVKMFAYKPLLIVVSGETIRKYVESEVDIHVNA